MWREGEKGSESAGLQRRGEQEEYGRAVTELRSADFEDRPPEQERCSQETQVLQRMHRLAGQGRLIRPRKVPNPQRNRVQAKSDGRQRHGLPAATHSIDPRPGAELSTPRLRKSPDKRNQRAPEDNQWRAHRNQQLVLRHVRREEDAAKRV